jgi:hypothetical protein
MELNENSLDKVAGGKGEMKVVESKDGEFFLVHSDAKGFKTEEQAKKALENFPPHGKHPHHHGGHYCQKNQKPE